MSTLLLHCASTIQSIAPSPPTPVEAALARGGAPVDSAPAAIAISLSQPSLIQAPPSEKPVYKRGWFWAAVSSVIVGTGVGIGLGAYYGTHQSVPLWNGGILIGR